MQETRSRFTISDLSKLLGVRRHRLDYAVTEYGIEPAERAGIVRLWSSEQLPQIKSALDRISGRREAA